jgi:hypothetical protein
MTEYHRIPRSYGGWIGGSIIRCDAPAECRWCAARFPIDPAYTQLDAPKEECEENDNPMG